MLYNIGKGIQIGIVKDNVDPEKMHRVLVEFPVESVEEIIESYWCRVITPMAGKDRGLVMIPGIGTEVIVGFSAKSLTPYILGAVYNGNEDKPEPYKNDDEENNLRLFWSRNDHMFIFDDTEGAEKVALGAKAGSRMDETSGPIYQTLSSAEKKITEYCDGDTSWQADNPARGTISIKCTDFKLYASNSIKSESVFNTPIKAGGSQNIEAGGKMEFTAAMIRLNEGDNAFPRPTLPLPAHLHPPKK